MKIIIQNIIQNFFKKYGYKITSKLPPDFSENEIKIINYVESFTMTSPERIFSLMQSVKYIIKNDIPGDFVECGVWRGGTMMAIAKTLLEINNTDRDLYLFDTFEGMPKPTKMDVSREGISAIEEFSKRKLNEDSSKWCFSTLEDVKQAMYNTGYPKNKIHFIKGKVEDTIPLESLKKIALLRLDTDWYESTKHELTYLFPQLSSRGVIIFDDYGYWEGAKKATDEYFQKNKIKILLNRTDSCERIGVKE